MPKVFINHSNEKPKLLVADSTRTIQKVVELSFEDEGIEVLVANDGDEALRILGSLGISGIVLADVGLPGSLNGYELCRNIKSTTRFQHLPVILLFSSLSGYDKDLARHVGADHAMSKPFSSIRLLVETVNQFLPKE